MANPRLPLLPLILDGVPEGLRQALAQEGVPVSPRHPGPPQGRFLLFDSRGATREPPAAGQIPVDVNAVRKACRGDPWEDLLDEGADRFQWQIAELTLTERIARIDKRSVRRQLLEALRTRIEKAGGIWLRVSPFPFPYRSAFNFRIDYDQYDPDDFDATLQAIAGSEHATSHFVCASAYEPAPEALARLRGLDVGSHGYWHHTYRTAEENLRNIGRGIETLRAAGIEPSGFAAPHGRFHRRLLLALDTLGITHSSEFGLAYDDLPFFIAGGNVLEIPVHPVSLGLFLEAAAKGPRNRVEEADHATAAAVEAATDYFAELAKARYRSGEPAFLYGHPTGRLGRYPRVVRHVLDTVSRFHAVWKTTLTEFSDWWRARAQVQLTVLRHEDQYVVAAGRMASKYAIGVEYWRGQHVALMPLKGRVMRFSSAALAYESRQPWPSVRPVRFDRPEGLRGRVRRFLDWERVTPIEEIGTGDLRNWAKRTLRRLWSD